MSDGIKIKVEGLTEMIASFQQYESVVAKATAAALYQEAEKVMTESKGLVPVDTGTLRSTGHVEAPRVSGPAVSVTLGYGGPAAPYAIVQHEDLSLHHPHGGQAKYLEQPLLAAIPELRSGLAASIQANLERLLKRK